MRPTTHKASLVLLTVAAAAVSSFASADDLKIGAPAPDFKVSSWVKGKEIKEFEKGKIYVVEFWATWCGPCKVSIPHLTEMAKKFKDVSFIGVDSFERPADNLDAVKKFVADMGDKMDYNVAVDGSPAFMADNWMKAAKQNGIPTAFIVDKDSKIAWIGHPMEMEAPLEQIVGGTYDSKAEADKKAMEDAKEESMQKHGAKLQEYVQAGDYKSAIKEIDGAIAEMPETEAQLGPVKFQFMAQIGDEGANAYAKHLFEKVLADNAVQLNQVAWYMVDDETNFKKADLDLALKISMKSNELAMNKDASLMDTLGYIYFKKGDIKKAIEVQEKAVKLAEADPNLPDETKEELKGRLEKFKKAKK